MHLSLLSRVRSGVGNIAGNDGFDFVSHHTVTSSKPELTEELKPFLSNC